MKEARVFNWGNLPRETLENGEFERTAIRADGSIVMFNWFHPGFPQHALHQHPFDQLVLVFSGTLNMIAADKHYTVGPGMAFYIPPDVPHTGYPVGDETVFSLDIFSPARKDYLFLAVNQADWGEVPVAADKTAPFLVEKT